MSRPDTRWIGQMQLIGIGLTAIIAASCVSESPVSAWSGDYSKGYVEAQKKKCERYGGTYMKEYVSCDLSNACYKYVKRAVPCSEIVK